MRRRSFPLLAAAATLVVLAGCGLGGNTYADLDRDPGEGPALPESPHLDAERGVDLESARWVGEYAGANVWLAAGIDDVEVCVLVDPADQGALSTPGYLGGGGVFAFCGTREVAGSGRLIPSVAIVADGHESESVPASATRLSENVWAWGEE